VSWSRTLSAAISVTLLVLGTACGAGAGPPVQGTTAPSRPADGAARGGAPPPAAPAPGAGGAREPRGFLIYLTQRDEPIVVSRYTLEDGQVVFEKYGGQIRIPEAQVSKIVPDVPDEGGSLPRPAPSDIAGPPSRPEPPDTAAGPPPPLYLALRGGSNFKVTELAPEGDRVRVSAADGTFTVPRADILGFVRVPPGPGTPEAWLSLEGAGVPERPAPGPVVEGQGDPRIPYPTSARPHRLQLANGQVMQVEGFWAENGIVRFRRFGGIVAVARSEVVGLFPESTAPLEERMAVRLLGQLGRDLLEVQARGESRQVRLAGVEMVDEPGASENPWSPVERGATLYLEFDRQRSDAEGRWLAYVFLPNGRMLNAELVRLGLARPRVVEGNVRYADLFEELVARPSTKRPP
jgi:hypothetical protein